MLLVQWVRHDPKLSPIDEPVHLDYVIRVSHGQIPRIGNFVTPQAAEITACTGVDLKGLPIPPCHMGKLNVRDFPGGGYQYEAQQPPLYYGVTALLRPVAAAAFGTNYLTSTRATGYVWWALGLLFLWLAGRALDVDPWAMVGVTLLLACARDVIYYSSIVSNDAASLLVGSGLLFAIALALRRPSLRSAIILGLLGVAAALIKASDAFAPFALAIFAAWTLLREVPDRRLALRRWVQTGGALLAGSIVGLVAWQLIRGHIALVDPSVLPVVAGYPLRGGARLGPFLENLTSFFDPVTGSAGSSLLHDSLQVPFAELLRTLLLVAAFLGLFVRRRAWFHRLGLSTLVAMMVGAVAIAVGFWVTLGENPVAQSRYGISLAPLLAVGLAAAVDATEDKRITAMLGGLSAVSLAVMLAILA